MVTCLSAVIASDNIEVPVDSLAQTLVYNGDSTLNYIQVTYNDNIYVPGVTALAIPATPSPIVAAGPGAFTGSQLAITAVAATVPGGMLGKNGRIDFQFYGSHTNSAGNKIYTMNYGGQQLGSQAATTSATLTVPRYVVANRGREDRQVSSNAAITSTSSASPALFSVDSTVDALAEIKLQHSTAATDVIILECASIVVDPS